MPSANEPDQPTKDKVIAAVMRAMASRYEGVEWLGAGATGYVLRLRERSLGHLRAVKILRPDVPDVEEGGIRRTYAEYFAREIEHLGSLTHENVVQIYERGSITLDGIAGNTTGVPYYVMEYIDGQALNDYLVQDYSSLTERRVLDLIVQLANGIAAIHASGVLHGDIKPANIRVSRRGNLKITDFGFAKSLNQERKEGSFWCQDKRYLHPELRAKLLESRINQPQQEERTIIPVTADDLENRGEIWELHSVGQTLEEIVYSAEGAGSRPIFSDRNRGFLQFTIARLRDPRELGGWTTPPRIDSYGKVKTAERPSPPTAAVELARDLAKLATPSDLGGDAPELQVNYHRTIRVPVADPIPLSDRLQSIINHPLFQRLANVSQLGVVNLVFRSAKHTRFEHSLGVLATSIQYLRALWNSKTGSYFRQIVRPEDCSALLLAAVLHDLGQYPFAHAFEESEMSARALYSHASLTRGLIRAESPENLELGATLFNSEDRQRVGSLLRDTKGRLLKQIIEGTGKDEWSTKLDDVLYLLGDDAMTPRPALTILRRIIDGPIDADKMDYLRRDALHLGMQVAVDPIEFLRFLTVVPTVAEDSFDLGIEEEGVSVAQDLHFTRYNMFVNVYWERVVRSAERMLRYAVDGLRRSLGEEHFRKVFFAQILTSSDSELVSHLIRESKMAAQPGGANADPFLNGITDILKNIEIRQLHYEAYVLDAKSNADLHAKLSHLWEHSLRDQDAQGEFGAFTERFFSILGSSLGKKPEPHQVLLDIPDPKTEQPSKYTMWLRTQEGHRAPIELSSPIWKEFSELFRMHGRRIRVFAERKISKRLRSLDFVASLNSALADVPAQYLQKPVSPAPRVC